MNGETYALWKLRVSDNVQAVSNVNYETGATVANAAIVRLAPDGTVCLFTSSPTELVADVSGYFTA